MSVRKCPHMVRHGEVDKDGNLIFTNMCGLVVRKLEGAPPIKMDFPDECTKHPFERGFDYFSCDVYKTYFKTSGLRNNVNVSGGIDYGNANSGSGSGSITEMDLL